MKNVSLAAFFALALAAASGCAGSTTDDAAAGTADLTAATPVTVQNFISHPRIVAIRKEVEATNAAKYASATKEVCGDPNQGEIGATKLTKLTDPNGKIRELVVESGGEDSASSTTVYYDANGKQRFQFQTHNDTSGNKYEYRLYFDATGAELFAVARHAFSETLDADITKSPYEPIEEGFVPDLDGVTANPVAFYDARPPATDCK